MSRKHCIHCGETQNVHEGAIGVSGTGKSTFMLRHVIEYATEHQALVIAHDAEGNLPDTFPDGKPSGVKRYESVEEAAAGIAEDPSGVHAVESSDCEAVVQLALDWAAADMQEGSDGQIYGHMVVLLIDEIVLAKDAAPSKFGDQLKETITQRRHRNIAVFWTTQHPGLVHYQMLASTTNLYIFAIEGKKAKARLDEAEVPDEIKEGIENLPDYEHRVWSSQARRNDRQKTKKVEPNDEKEIV